MERTLHSKIGLTKNQIERRKNGEMTKRLSYVKEEPSSESKEVTFPAQYLKFIKLKKNNTQYHLLKGSNNRVGVTQIAAE